MWGPGAIVSILNILPFASFILSPFLYRRGNLLGMDPYGMTRTQTRKIWVRLFFGRFNYTVFTLFGAGYLVKSYTMHKQGQRDYFWFTSPMYEAEEYDETETPVAHDILLRRMTYNRVHTIRELVLRERAKRNHDLKIQAFEQYAKENSI